MRRTLLLGITLLSTSVHAQVVRCPPRADCARPIIIAPARIARTASDARLTLDGRVLRYEITETFVNRGNTVGEADYVMPLPRGAAFEDLALEINGELVAGETMTSDRARGIYEEIVRKSRDPALVEWMDHGLLRTRIFPIAPGETKRVVVRFRVVPQREGNALRIEYLAGGRTPGSVESTGSTSLTLLLPRGEGYGEPYSPTHQIETTEPSRRNASFGREVHVRGDASRMTLLLPIRLSATATISTLPYAPPGEDGFAMITLSPPVSRTVTMPRDVTFVIDVSGSMSGEKLAQAKAAGRTLLNTLSANDQFRMISFATDVSEFQRGWAGASAANIRLAQRWLDDLSATGSTNIEGALDRALDETAARGHLGIVLFLTDGAATVGDRNPERLAALASTRRGGMRIFTFGVGADVQAAMLERIALEGRGTAHFVQPSEDVEHAVGVVASRLTAPVATNVRLRSSQVSIRQVMPEGAQDVFVGQDLTYFVRYREGGPTNLVFTGDTPNGPVEWTERVTLPERSRDNAFVAKLWAVQRVGWLSAERRRGGANPELDNELRELGTKYGIPTELTSYLVVEPGMVLQSRAVGAGMGGRGGTPVRNEFEAARAAADQRSAKTLAAPAAAAPPAVVGNASRESAQSAPKQIGDRTFVNRDGRWTDLRVRDGVRKVSVKPYGAAYFALLNEIPELKSMFAIGDSVSVGGRNVVIVVDAGGVSELSADELAALKRDW
jgi:Ca-activated chloride channel family protein